MGNVIVPDFHKQCIHCKAIKPLPEFYLLGAPSYNRSSVCRACKSAANKKNTERYSKTKRCRVLHNIRKERYKKESPEKHAARRELQNAVRAGRIKRQPCEVCGALPTEGHHDDYGKPLDVRWLCKVHHHALHKPNPRS